MFITENSGIFSLWDFKTFFFFFFPQDQKNITFSLFLDLSKRSLFLDLPYFSKMGLGKGTVGGAGSPEVIVQAGTEHYNESFRPQVSFWISSSQLDNLPTILLLLIQYWVLTSPFFAYPFRNYLFDLILANELDKKVSKTSPKRQYNFITIELLDSSHFYVLSFLFPTVLELSVQTRISFKMKQYSNFTF